MARRSCAAITAAPTSAAEQPLLSLARFGFFALTLTIEIHSSVRVSRRGGGRHFASVQSGQVRRSEPCQARAPRAMAAALHV